MTGVVGRGAEGIEDAEIVKLIRKQEEIGLEAVTDGEFRAPSGTSTSWSSSTA